MKLNGNKLNNPNETIIPIPRANGADIVLKARAVQSLDDFEKLCPPPKPPVRKFANGQTQENIQDPGFLKQVENHAKQRLSWVVLKSLEANETLEWEKVDISDPTTWDHFKDEMGEAGFSHFEIQRIVTDCLGVNALDEYKIEAARQRFLLAAQEAESE